jgi:integrase
MVIPTRFSLFKRTNGIYYISYFLDSERRWKSTRTKLKSEALAFLSEFKDEIKTQTQNIKLSKFTEEFLDYAKAIYADKTIAIYRRMLKDFREICGDRMLCSYSIRHLDRYKATRAKSVAPTSVNIELRALSACFNTAVRWKYLAENPFSGMKKLPVPEKIPNYINKEQFELLVNDAKGWLKDIIIFGVLTGLRRGEILNLRYRDVDLEKRLIYVVSNQNFQTKHGKRRIVPMNDLVWKFLSDKTEKNNNEDGYIFTLKNSDLPIEGNYATKKFRELVRRLGLDKSIHFHSLRHTFATWLVKAGVSIYEVQKLLGHSNVTVTQVYSHLASDELHSAVARLHL